jgi:hypothetical protein
MLAVRQQNLKSFLIKYVMGDVHGYSYSEESFGEEKVVDVYNHFVRLNVDGGKLLDDIVGNSLLISNILVGYGFFLASGCPVSKVIQYFDFLSDTPECRDFISKRMHNSKQLISRGVQESETMYAIKRIQYDHGIMYILPYELFKVEYSNNTILNNNMVQINVVPANFTIEGVQFSLNVDYEDTSLYLLKSDLREILFGCIERTELLKDLIHLVLDYLF